MLSDRCGTPDARGGYLAIAPELYFRQGAPNDYSDIPTLFKELVSKVPDAQVLADLDHVAFLVDDE